MNRAEASVAVGGSDEMFPWESGLPRGFSVVEASAGTGKTYTLAGLAALAIAEGHCTTSELLLLTFGRNAAAEIRHRVRERLTSALVALKETPEPRDHPGDQVLTELVRVEGAARDSRIERLALAVTEFDLATIGTIHGFAQRALKASGSHAGIDRGLRLVDDAGERIPEMAADQVTIVALGPRRGELLKAKPANVATVMSAVSSTPGIVIRPDSNLGDVAARVAGVSEWDLLRTQMVKAGLEEINRARSERASMSFDDLLSTVADALGDTGSAVSDYLRRQYKVALIDEFQDTDPAQWRMLRSLFPGDGPGTLVVVGDPKQAIYSFRGANISTYRSAVRSAPGSPFRLTTNFRSSSDALEGVANLFRGAQFGDESISFVEVGSADGAQIRHLTRGGVREPGLRIRSLYAPKHETKKGVLKTPAARDLVIDDMAEQIVASLETGSLHEPVANPGVSAGSDTDDNGLSSRPLRPDDMAVLVRTGAEATQVLEALRRRGVPAVLSRSGSVLLSPAAEQWRWLLHAMVRPADGRRVRSFAISWFGGATPSEVAGWTDEDLEAHAKLLNEWSVTLAASGPEAMVRKVMAESKAVDEALRRHDGDRAYTDLVHVSEFLTADESATSPTSLLDMLSEEQPPDDAEADRDSDLAARRVESDERAVQVMTVWVAKGLEFPLVFCPTLFCKGLPSYTYDDPDSAERTHWYSESKAKAQKARNALAEADQAAERLRLLYVALTRAEYQTHLWWAHTEKAEGSPVGRVLFGRRPEGVLEGGLHEVAIETPPLDAQLEALQNKIGQFNNVDVSPCSAEVQISPRRWVPGSEGPDHREGPRHGDPEGPEGSDPTGRPSRSLSAAELSRDPDRSRNRWSFTAIADRDQTPPNPMDESGGDTGADDELIPPDEPPPVATASTDTGHAVSDLAHLPAGAAFGTLAHRILERVAFETDHLESDIAGELAEAQAFRRLNLDYTNADGEVSDGASKMVSGLVQVIATPLGEAFNGATLGDFARSDRLDEVNFDMRLGGPAGSVTVTEVAGILLEHLEPDGAFLDWTKRLADGLFEVDLKGMLTGSIDLVAGVRGSGDAPERFVVADYKSNRLHLRGTVPRPGDYSEPNMVEAMEHHNYPLQALLYQVALHRYLRSRLTGYDPEVHLGGASYLFLRGMAGPDSLPGEGVMSWRWPVAAVGEISDALAGVRP